jgi:hypothetical protein
VRWLREESVYSTSRCERRITRGSVLVHGEERRESFWWWPARITVSAPPHARARAAGNPALHPSPPQRNVRPSVPREPGPSSPSAAPARTVRSSTTKKLLHRTVVETSFYCELHQLFYQGRHLTFPSKGSTNKLYPALIG